LHRWLTSFCPQRINENMIKAVFCLCLLVSSAHAVETLRPEQLKPGMKGYGLSVFKGTTPERFEAEIIGVLKNALPKQDMILVRLSGAQLEKHRTIAGMSGSPVYIDGKLIGAVAYGWSFENDPIFGVTPIHNMLAEIDKPPGGGAPMSLANPSSDNAVRPRPLLTPLALGGFSPRTIELFADQFRQWGVLPVAAGGASETSHATGQLVPGGAIGIELIRGDLSATGVGTVTYVDGDKVLAFGHPFFSAGQISAPAVEAEVHTILSSMELSFKMATGKAEAGALIGDWQSCIVANRKMRASMIPISVDVVNRDTGDNDSYRLEIADNAQLSPLLAQVAIAQVVQGASGSSRQTTIHMQMEAELTTEGEKPRTLNISDVFFNPQGGLINAGMLQPVGAMFHTPFGDPKVKRLAVHVQAEQTRQTAEIKRAYFGKAQVERGDHVLLTVVLKPFGKDEITRTFEVDVPAATDTMRFLSVAVMAGNDAPADIAPPDSMADYLDSIEKGHQATELVALVQTPTQGLQYRGKLLKKLPASVVSLLDDETRRDVSLAADTLQLVLNTPWVLSGQATARVPIRQE
jgi:hypothetical protein